MQLEEACWQSLNPPVLSTHFAPSHFPPAPTTFTPHLPPVTHHSHSPPATLPSTSLPTFHPSSPTLTPHLPLITSHPSPTTLTPAGWAAGENTGPHYCSGVLQGLDIQQGPWLQVRSHIHTQVLALLWEAYACTCAYSIRTCFKQETIFITPLLFTRMRQLVWILFLPEQCTVHYFEMPTWVYGL